MSQTYRGRYSLSEYVTEIKQPHSAYFHRMKLDARRLDSEFILLPLNDIRHTVQLSLWQTANTVMPTVKRCDSNPSSQPPPLPNSATSLVDRANLVENWYKNGDKMLKQDDPASLIRLYVAN